MSKQDLLFELLTEDLPAKTLSVLGQDLVHGVMSLLKRSEFSYGNYKVIASPRRLGFFLQDVSPMQPVQKIERKGPAILAAYDAEGKLTKAALGFAAFCGIDFSQVTILKTDKGEWLYYKGEQAGKSIFELLPEMIQQAIAALPIPKPMTWGDGEFSFLRPVHGVVALFGKEIIPMTLFGIKSGRETVGHRFHHPEKIIIHSTKDYFAKMADAKVMPLFAERYEVIKNQVVQLAEQQKATAVMPEELLIEVTGLVEWPVALLGQFEERFLQVPKEVLILSMQTNQKYFALEDNAGNLAPFFITISNIESKDPAMVIHGNERVLRARFSDAEFFYLQDQKIPLAANVATLKSIIFQKELGTLWDKTERLKTMAKWLAEKLQLDTTLAERAAFLAKADLVTGMVGEFPELQGVMGKYYAILQGEKKEVAQALDEQYQPRFAEDVLPASKIGQVLALADRLDTLVGIFGVGLLPTGDKDPFALRRAALGILRILLEYQFNFDLKDLVKTAYENYPDQLKNKNCQTDVLHFCLERLRNLMLEQGYSAELIQSVYALGLSCPLDIMHRAQAVQQFMQVSEAQQLIAANKRVSNILSKNAFDPSVQPKAELLQVDAEKALYAALEQMQQKISKMNNAQILLALAHLQKPIDQFFDEVMVMADDPVLKTNRLALLYQLRQMFLQVADISCL